MTVFLNELNKHKIISIIGLAKNVSKTTTLNYILRNLDENFIVGLTSIGRDGEKYDILTQLPKPRIYIRRGNYIATAKQCFEESEINFEIIKNTGVSTPLGDVMILKALGDGYIELAGPSINKYLNDICSDLKNLGCDLILVDGAFDRKSYATPLISDATILSTGASVSKNMHDVIDLTVHTLKLLSLEKEEDLKITKLSKEILKNSRIGIIDKKKSINTLNIATALDAANDIIVNLNENSKYVVIKGAITDKLLEDLMKLSQKYKKLTFLVEDGTKMFLSRNTFEKFQKKGGILKVLNPINIIAITINPTSPLGHKFDKITFLQLLREKINIPIYDLGVNN